MTVQSIPPARPGSPFDIVFLDRDGTLNVQIVDDYVRVPEQLELLPGAAEAVALLNEAGCRVVVVTNQRGVARGLMTQDDVARVHDRLATELAGAGAMLDAVLVCPHESGTCTCRKPEPGLLLQALGAAPWAHASRCLLVGDMPSDLAAAREAGVRAVQVGGGGRDLLGVVLDEVGRPDPS